MEPHAARFTLQLPATTAVLLAALCIAWFVAASDWIPGAIDDDGGVPAWFSRGEVAIPASGASSDHAACERCGTIESVSMVDKLRNPPGVAMLAGGKGSEVMAVLHVVLNAMVGNPTRPVPGPLYEITVRFHDGSKRTITETGTPTWKPGDPVRLINGVIRPDA